MAYIDPNFIHRMNINVREKYEVKVWCELFKCDKDTLFDAISKVGNNAGKVKILINRAAHA